MAIATEDLFTSIHKGLRAMIYELSDRLQTNDCADLPATRQLVTDLEHDFELARSAGCVVCILNKHADDEEVVIFPEVTRHGNDLVTSLIQEHHELARREQALARAAHEMLEMDSPERRVAAGVRLNQGANELFALYFEHMNREETELVPLMQQRFTDAQMVAMRSTIMRGMPRDRMFAILGWMLPSLNVSELTRLLSSLRESAPPPLMKAVTDLCESKVDPARWNAVQSRMGT